MIRSATLTLVFLTILAIHAIPGHNRPKRFLLKFLSGGASQEDNRGPEPEIKPFRRNFAPSMYDPEAVSEQESADCFLPEVSEWYCSLMLIMLVDINYYIQRTLLYYKRHFIDSDNLMR